MTQPESIESTGPVDEPYVNLKENCSYEEQNGTHSTTQEENGEHSASPTGTTSLRRKRASGEQKRGRPPKDRKVTIVEPDMDQLDEQMVERVISQSLENEENDENSVNNGEKQAEKRGRPPGTKKVKSERKVLEDIGRSALPSRTSVRLQKKALKVTLSHYFFCKLLKKNFSN